MKIPGYKAIICMLMVTGCVSSPDPHRDKVTTGTLLDEMLDLNRLTILPEHPYHIAQYSSYDRGSKSPEDPGWFSNSDGFGEESTPGFLKVLQQPDANGIGNYLICDIRNPGAILRLWTAGINGKIRLFLDGGMKPVFEGDAKEFFWKTIESISDTGASAVKTKIVRQYDAVYFPIPFSKRCRIEWTGNVNEIHFYHVTVRIYDSKTGVRTFKKEDIKQNIRKLEEIGRRFGNASEVTGFRSSGIQTLNMEVPGKSKKQLFKLTGAKAIDVLAFKIKSAHLEDALRKNILSIYFDNSSVPQVQAPIGDFFGAAPGLNPYQSLPFAVQNDSTMICRFVMPFKTGARIEIENNSDEGILISGGVNLAGYEWVPGKSMYFHARWRITHGLTASDRDITDIPYIMAFGKGRIVGAAAFIYNPSNAVTSWGNWWGEGDEKIYVDRDTFPSVFGTGSEDYFNYSWSSEAVFSFPYCGQPRNDGPGNRGYVSNYRWHIVDDIPFYDKCAFYMELLHHGVVTHFSYGRIVYLYALPTLIDDYQKISMTDIGEISYLKWNPMAYLGSAGYTFINAEKVIARKAGIVLEKGRLWAGDSILMWTPARENERITFRFRRINDTLRSNIGLTLAHIPDGGEISLYLNGKQIKFDGGLSIQLAHKNNPILSNHFSETIQFKKGENEFTLENRNAEPGRKIGLDFIWLKEEQNGLHDDKNK